MTHPLGTRLTWTSQAGEVVCVVQARVTANHALVDSGMAIVPGWSAQSRDHVSYIIRATAHGRTGSRLYWPRAAGLRVDNG